MAQPLFMALLLLLPLGTVLLSRTPDAIPLGRKPILMPDAKIGRRDPVLHGVVWVRFRPEHLLPHRQSVLPPLPLANARLVPLLPWGRSLHAGVCFGRYPSALHAALRAEEPLLRTFLVEYTEPRSPEEVCKALLSRCPAVEIAEPYTLNLPLFTPNDPLLPRQQLLWTINAFAAWDIAQGDSTTVIGIVDTGVLYTHEDLIGSLWYNRGEIPNNNADDDGNGYIDDYLGYNFASHDDGTPPGDPRNAGEGHGTSVAGIAAATVNNGKGIAGIAYHCRIFPIKAAPEGVPALYYAYQGILYCAQMGFAVVNCSWGNRTYSCINQSIIEYAHARGTLVVAAAGNTPETTSAWYPAGYPGVIGVANAYVNDQLHPQSARGIGATLVAPGEEAWTTSNDGTYSTFGGTSAAAPIVSAAAALLRSFRPQLDPFQTAALLRRTAEDISHANPELAPWLPGRINVWAALSSLPEEAPGFVLPRLYVLSTDGHPRRRWGFGDTLWLRLQSYNALGPGGRIRCRLLPVADTALLLLDTLIIMDQVPPAASVVIGPFRAIVRANSSNPVLLRIEFWDSLATYRDVLFTTMVPSPTTITFANATTSFSLSDDGALGFADYPQNLQGLGFRYRDACNLLYSGGIFAVENATGRAVSAAPSGWTRDHDFSVLKPFAEPEEERNLLSDANALPGNRIGLLLQQQFIGFASDSSGIARLLVTAWNISGLPLNDVAIGYFMDWDIGSGGRGNRVRLLPEVYVPEIPLPHGAEVVEYPGSPSVGACLISLAPTAEIQCAGISTALLYDSDGFSKAEKLSLLTHGTAIQHSDSGDVALVVGLRFRESWQPNQPKQFLLCFGAADSTAALAEQFRECVRLAQQLSIPHSDFAFPHPMLTYADGFLSGTLPTGGVWMVEIWDVLGRCVERQSLLLPGGELRILLPPLPAGIFFVRLTSAHFRWHQLILVH